MPTRSSIALALAALFLSAAADGAAAPVPTVRIARVSVKFGHPVVVTGKHWPARKGCPRRVDILLSSPQRRFVAGHAKVAKNGSWTFRYKQKDLGIGAFTWRLGARERCAGSTIRTTGTIRITIHG